MSLTKPFIKEACVETLEQAIAAEKGGADRIELCANLDVDGLTPPKDLIIEVSKHLNIPIRVMIRPRAGNFIFSEKELTEMKASIIICRITGVEGVVFGALKTDHNLNIDAISILTNLAFPLKVVIHKAIDDTPDLLKSLKKLSLIKGVSTVLTSGGANTVFEGEEILKKMIKISPKEIEIMPAGKITDVNLNVVHSLLGASAYHGKRIVGTLD
jgi:copper homeostasis protein